MIVRNSETGVRVVGTAREYVCFGVLGIFGLLFGVPFLMHLIFFRCLGWRWFWDSGLGLWVGLIVVAALFYYLIIRLFLRIKVSFVIKRRQLI